MERGAVLERIEYLNITASWGLSVMVYTPDKTMTLNPQLAVLLWV